jgi:hypothetical protein
VTTFINPQGLPAAYVRAVCADPYTAGSANISVTSLIGPAQLRTLRQRHDDELVEDVADRVWSLLGQLCHALLERAAGWESPADALARIYDIVMDPDSSPLQKVDDIKSLLRAYRVDTPDIIERRLYAELEGWKISGQIDMLREDAADGWGIGDWKLTSVWTWIYGGRQEWEDQLNVYAWLARRNGHFPKWLRIYAIFRDWRETEVRSSPDYPPKPIMVLNIPLWDDEKAEIFVRHRVEMHKFAAMLPNDALPECSDKERWAKPASWAVLKQGIKTAKRVLPTREQAEDWVDANVDEKDLPKMSIVYRPGESVRCARYCPVRRHCHQRAKEIGFGVESTGTVVREVG